MNYRHIYHAGIFADVVKHVVLVELVLAMQRKDKGFCYLDTHAGIGRYDLRSVEAQKTLEHEEGILKVLKAEHAPEGLRRYLSIVEEANNALDSRLRGNDVRRPREGGDPAFQFYPGSPCIAQSLLRPQDRMILNELHPEDVQTLKQEFKRDAQVSIHQRDAYEFLQAVLPPAEKRGLILIDPAYEKTDELERLLESLQKVLKKFSNGVYAIWLPIKDQSYQDFYKNLKTHISQEMLIAELTLVDVPEQAFGLIGCAMIIVNPPFQLKENLQPQLEWLWDIWTNSANGKVKIDIL